MAGPTPELWTIRITCDPALAETLEDALSEDSLAVSTLIPPRTATALVEAIVDGEPSAAHIELRVALALQPLADEMEAARHQPKIEIAPVGNLDWIKKVSEDFPPLPIARWTIFGAAHKKAIKNPRLALQIDATSAFGTGEHPTTRGCLILLDELLKRNPDARNWSMLDMGCGSGILAMAFARAVRGRGFGVDMDAPSVKIAQENARFNGVREQLRYVCSLGYRHPLIPERGPFDLVMANIFARPLCQMAKDLKRHLKPGGYAILSGLLNSQANAVLSAHRQQGLYLVKRMRLGEWSVLALHHPIKAS